MNFKTLLILCMSAAVAFAENDNPLKRAMETLNSSKIAYSVKELKKPFPEPDRSKLLNMPAYRKTVDGGYKVTAFEFKGDLKKAFDKAEDLFAKKEYAKARDAYKRVLLLDPNATIVMAYIAQTFGIEQNWDMAESWYKKAIEANYIDYLAHWLLADVYRNKGEQKKALEEISIAKVLNRNNPRLESLRQKIYAANGLDSSHWAFNPQARVLQTPDGSVVVEADTLWLYYAFIEAAWKFEPEYKKRAEANKDMGEAMIKECLAGLLPKIDERKANSKTLARLDKALSAGKINSFIVYEIILPDRPSLAYYLDKKQIESLKDYVIWSNQK